MDSAINEQRHQGPTPSRTNAINEQRHHGPTPSEEAGTHLPPPPPREPSVLGRVRAHLRQRVERRHLWKGGRGWSTGTGGHHTSGHEWSRVVKWLPAHHRGRDVEGDVPERTELREQVEQRGVLSREVGAQRGLRAREAELWNGARAR